VPGPLLILQGGAPIHRRHLINAFLANGAAPHIHPERLPAYAPELNPGEGLWGHLKGAERRNVCCFTISHIPECVKFDLIVQTKNGNYTSIKYRGPIEGLDKIRKIIDGVHSDS
jgi:transposase